MYCFLFSISLTNFRVKSTTTKYITYSTLLNLNPILIAKIRMV